jgi:hypothetical protein
MTSRRKFLSNAFSQCHKNLIHSVGSFDRLISVVTT